mgnify:CR=1 FL=1
MAQERNISNGTATPLACGREPFLDDSICDRGNVDVHAFDNFPVCSILDPTPPDVATPQVDFPVIPITPPPCACVFINTQGGGGVENIDDVLVSFDFASVGDCCEGNYQMDLDIRIPCMPFDIIGGSDSHPVEIEMDCTTESPEGTFNLGITADNCAINIEPQIKLKIPKTPDIKFNDPDLQFETVVCPEQPYCHFWTTVDSHDCTRTVTPHLHMAVAEPNYFDTCSSWDVNIEQTTDDNKKLGGTGTIEVEKEYVGKDRCCLKYLCPTLNLDLPCPLPDDDIKVKAKLDWSAPQSDSATIATMHAGDCGFDVNPDVLELGLPCPIDNIVVTPEVSWADESHSIPESSIVMKRKKDKCEFEVGENLKIAIPCALDNLEIVGAPPESDGDPYIVATKVDDPDGGDDIASGGKCSARWELKIVMSDRSSSPSSSSSSSSNQSSSSSEEYCEYIEITGNLDGHNKKTEKLHREGDGMTLPVSYGMMSEDSIVRSIEVTVSPDDPSKHVVAVSTAYGTEYTTVDAPTYSFGFYVDFWDGEFEHSSAYVACADSSSSSSSTRSSSSSTSSPTTSSSTSKGSSGGSGSSGKSGDSSGKSGSSGTSGGSGSGSPEPKTASFQAVTSVECGDGKLNVITSTFTIDFTNCTVSKSEATEERGPIAEDMARRMFETTIMALRRDPGLVSIVDAPDSEEAKMALARLGFHNGIANDMKDDSFIDDWRNV